jgi:GNAT superfamily N-acetyltransferase
MRTIQSGDAARALESRFPADLPARQRLLGVIDGVLVGAIRADDAAEPAWITITELSDGTTYVAGTIEPARLSDVLAGLAPASAEIVVGFSGPDDPVRDMVPVEGKQLSRAIDFAARVPPPDDKARLAVPDGLAVVPMDAALFARTAWYADTVTAFGSVERWLELGLGMALLDASGDLLCDATAGPIIRGRMEMGVRTGPEHRGRGYATLTARHLARAIEARGLAPWWNANADNEPSLRAARTLGFRDERPYDPAWWSIDAFR